MSDRYRRLVPYHDRSRTTDHSARNLADPSLPRVEQPYASIYPLLNVSEQLPVEFVNYDDETSETEQKETFDTTDDQSIAQVAPETTDANNAGYLQNEENKGVFSLPTTMLRNDPAGKEIYPENLMPDDPRAIPGAFDDLSLCEYDMDEQDLGILGYINAKFDVQLSADVFEVIMHMFELESFKLDLLMPPKQANLSKDGVDDTQQCVICNGADSDNGNAIIFCDGCDIAVHQDCYGVPFIPEGQWLCRRCMVGRGYKVSCKFCPQKSGAFKQTDTNEWSHVLCALWIPELVIRNTVFMEPVSNVEGVPRERYKLQCHICKQRRGACIQCVNKNCFQAFHATCAQSAGLYMQLSSNVSGALVDGKGMQVYCEKHTPPNADILVDISAARKALELEATEETVQAAAVRNGPRYPYWRTVSGIVMMPKLAREAIKDHIQARFNIDLSDILLFLSRYWALKRDAHGTMFSKRLKLALDTNKYSFAEKAERAKEFGDLETKLSKLLSTVKSVQKVLTKGASHKPLRHSRRLDQPSDVKPASSAELPLEHKETPVLSRRGPVRTRRDTLEDLNDIELNHRNIAQSVDAPRAQKPSTDNPTGRPRGRPKLRQRGRPKKSAEEPGSEPEEDVLPDATRDHSLDKERPSQKRTRSAALPFPASPAEDVDGSKGETQPSRSSRSTRSTRAGPVTRHTRSSRHIGSGLQSPPPERAEAPKKETRLRRSHRLN